LEPRALEDAYSYRASAEEQWIFRGLRRACRGIC